MIRVTVELLPKGRGQPQHLGTMEITNDGTGNRSRGNYTYRLSMRGKPEVTLRAGAVKGFPRRALLAWDLLYRVLHDAVGARNAKGVQCRTDS